MTTHRIFGNQVQLDHQRPEGIGTHCQLEHRLGIGPRVPSMTEYPRLIIFLEKEEPLPLEKSLLHSVSSSESID